MQFTVRLTCASNNVTPNELEWDERMMAGAKGCDHMLIGQSASVGWNAGFCKDYPDVNRTAMGQEQTANTWNTGLTGLLFLQQKSRNVVKVSHSPSVWNVLLTHLHSCVLV